MLSLCSRRMGCAEQRFGVYSPAGRPDAEAAGSHIHAFESGSFKGRFYLVSPQDPGLYFGGRQRQFQVVVQGSFKRAVKVSSLYVGQLWDERLQQSPPFHLKAVLDPLLRFIQPNLRQEICGDHPYLLSPAFSTLQTICLTDSARAEPPLITALDSLVDDLTLLSPRLAGLTAAQRKSHFSKAGEEREEYIIDPSVVCTFDFYTHAININSFDLLLGFFRYNVQQVLGSRLPIMHLLMQWDAGGEPFEEGRAEYAYCLEIWREQSPPPGGGTAAGGGPAAGGGGPAACDT